MSAPSKPPSGTFPARAPGRSDTTAAPRSGSKRPEELTLRTADEYLRQTAAAPLGSAFGLGLAAGGLGIIALFAWSLYGLATREPSPPQHLARATGAPRSTVQLDARARPSAASVQDGAPPAAATPDPAKTTPAPAAAPPPPQPRSEPKEVPEPEKNPEVTKPLDAKPPDTQTPPAPKPPEAPKGKESEKPEPAVVEPTRSAPAEKPPAKPAEPKPDASEKPEVVTVGSDAPGAVPSIKEALARVARGGEVRVLPGTYTEQLVLGSEHEGVALRGTQAGAVVIKLPDQPTGNTLVRISGGHDIRLAALVLDGGGKAERVIQADGAAGLTVEGNQLLGFTAVGVDLQAGDGAAERGYNLLGNTIKSGVKESQAHGVHVVGKLAGDAADWQPAQAVRIVGNKLSELGGEGVFLEGPLREIEVKDNTIWAVRTGIFHHLALANPEQIRLAQEVTDEVFVVNNSLYHMKDFGVRFSGPLVGGKAKRRLDIYYQNNLIIDAPRGGFVIEPHDKGIAGKEEDYRVAYHVTGNSLTGVGKTRAGVLPTNGNVTENPLLGSLDPAQEALFLRYDEQSPIAKRAVKADYAKPYIGAHPPYSMEDARAVKPGR